MVRVLAVADEVVDSLTHGLGVDAKPDLVLGAGDLPFDYLECLSTRFDAPCVYVPGNHDRDLRGFRRGRAGWTRAGLPTADPGPGGAVNADLRTVRVAGLRIAGLGGSRRYRSGPNQYSETQQRFRSLRLRARAIGRAPDILLTHSPARGVGDDDDAPHRGFDCYHRLVAALHPTVLVHGHVHPHGRTPTDRLLGDSTRSMNVVGYCQFEIDPGGGDLRILRRRHGA